MQSDNLHSSSSGEWFQHQSEIRFIPNEKSCFHEITWNDFLRILFFMKLHETSWWWFFLSWNLTYFFMKILDPDFWDYANISSNCLEHFLIYSMFFHNDLNKWILIFKKNKLERNDSFFASWYVLKETLLIWED